jgi:hypothetical protein
MPHSVRIVWMGRLFHVDRLETGKVVP